MKRNSRSNGLSQKTVRPILCTDRIPMRICATIFILTLMLQHLLVAEESSLSVDSSQKINQQVNFRIERPTLFLKDVPVPTLEIVALDDQGEVETGWLGVEHIAGVKLTKGGKTVPLPPFEKGRLILKTDPRVQQKVWITDEEIVISSLQGFQIQKTKLSVTFTFPWLSLVPSLLAVILAILFKHVLLALMIGVWSGAVLLAQGDLWQGSLDSVQVYLVQELVQEGMASHSHMLIILFTLFLGAMVSVMSLGGGTQGLVNRLTKRSTTREQGQMLTSGLGLFIFFDDYANTLMVGSAMRSVMDRLRISREKLAFLVDSTAAPVAGLMIVSTWVGVELGYISDSYSQLGFSSDVYHVFLVSVPYRFYPLFLLGFVWMIAATGRDFGPMRTAERLAMTSPRFHKETSPGNRTAVATSPQHRIATEEMHAKRELVRTALIPLGTLFLSVMGGLWYTGSAGLSLENQMQTEAGSTPLPSTVANILSFSNSNQVLCLSSLLASLAAVICVITTRSLSIREAFDAWQKGLEDILPAVVILALAWAISTICDSDHLNTAGYLVQITEGWLTVAFLPSIAFLLAAFVSFATGSSWSTMGLLIPLLISVSYSLLAAEVAHEVISDHPVMLSTIGAVLAGAIFGDHCSPISDTTVLSSAASGCDHLSHVGTQFPYAMTVALISLLLGYLPIGFQWGSVWLWLPLGFIALYVIVRFVGHKVDE